MNRRREIFITLTVFGFIAALLIIFESRPQFPDPDSFYHAKMALMLRDDGFIKTFPWLQWTDLKNVFVNPHLLYHLFLIPFVTIFPPPIGMKISAVIFGLAAFLAIYLFVKSLNTPHPWLFPLAAAMSPGFLYRMALPRAPALSVAVLLAATWAIIKEKNKTLFLLTTIFVWLYHGWPVIFLSLGAWLIATALTETINHRWKEKLKISARIFWQKKKTWLSIFGGVIAGLIINPYFPQNLKFSVLDIFKIGIINYQSVISVGQEWYPLPLSDLIFDGFPALLLCGLCLFFFIPGLLKEKKIPDAKKMTEIFAFLFLAGGYTVLCFKARRFKEYSIPFVILEAAVLFPFVWNYWLKEWQAKIKIIFEQTRRRKIVFRGLLTVIILGMVAGAIKTVVIKDDDYYQAKQYQIATDWIKENVPTGETIFHNVWDFSLILFYLDDTHNYLVGLDPSFMYDYDPAGYELWRKLGNGEDQDVSKIKNFFGARVVVIDKRSASTETFAKNLTDSGLFEKKVDNEWIEIYADPAL
jgi:hypothetical protein